MSKTGIPRKIINVYTDHLAKQEAEIEGLNNLLIDFRSKLGPIDLSSSAEFQKAKLEREIQELRKRNNEFQLQLNTEQSQFEIRKTTVRDMENALEDLIAEIAENKTPEISATEERVAKLEAINQNLDESISELEDILSDLLQLNRRKTA